MTPGRRKYSRGQKALLFVMGLLTGGWIAALFRAVGQDGPVTGPVLGLVSALGISAFVAFSGRNASAGRNGDTDGR